MPIFIYKAATKNGQVVTNRVEEINRFILLRRLKNNDLLPISVTQINARGSRTLKKQKRNVESSSSILKNIRSKERIDKLEVDSKKESEGIQKQSESLEIQMSNLQKQAKVYLDTQISIHQYSTLENRMTSLLLCMSSVPDPQVFSDSEERKEQVNYYLDLVSGLLIKYFKLIEQESECHKLPEGTVACIPMVLLNLRLSLIRIQGMFRDPGIYMAFVKLINLIKTNEKSIRRTQLFGKSEVKELGVLVKSFNDFKTEIANCNEVV